MGFYPFAPLPVAGSLITPPVALTEAAATGDILTVTNTTAAPNPSSVELIAAAAADNTLAIKVTGDTNVRWRSDSNGRMVWGPGNAAQDVAFERTGVGLLKVTTGSLGVSTAGQGLRVGEGSNAKQGTFVLAGAATTVVANTSVTANSRIIMTCQALGTVTAASTLAVSARTAGTSFTVTPSQATDTSTIAFEIFEPG